MTIINGMYQQSDNEKAIEEYCINELPRGREREQARREAKEDKWFKLTGHKMYCPNTRSEGQKRRWTEWRRVQGLIGVTSNQCVRLAKAWSGTYNLNREGK